MQAKATMPFTCAKSLTAKAGNACGQMQRDMKVQSKISTALRQEATEQLLLLLLLLLLRCFKPFAPHLMHLSVLLVLLQCVARQVDSLFISLS
jgi:hypothetical protein